MRLEPLWGVALILALASCKSMNTRWGEWENEFEGERKSWKEIQARLPTFPRQENLARVQGGSASPHSFFVDTSSISVGDDGVVRYTAVTRTEGGATNVTYEGMRCETREGKLYATGHADGTWTRARDTSWQRIVLRDLKPYTFYLYQEVFCPSRTQPTPLWDAVNALKTGRGLSYRARD